MCMSFACYTHNLTHLFTAHNAGFLRSCSTQEINNRQWVQKRDAFFSSGRLFLGETALYAILCSTSYTTSSPYSSNMAILKEPYYGHFQIGYIHKQGFFGQKPPSLSCADLSESTSLSLTRPEEAVLALVLPPLPAPSMALPWSSPVHWDWSAAQAYQLSCCDALLAFYKRKKKNLQRRCYDNQVNECTDNNCLALSCHYGPTECVKYFFHHFTGS